MYIVHHNPANLAARSINTYVCIYVFFIVYHFTALHTLLCNKYVCMYVCMFHSLSLYCITYIAVNTIDTVTF